MRKRANIFGTLPNSTVRQIIDEHIRGKHAERNRAILKRRLIDGITHEQIAEEFSMSTVQIKRVVYACERMLLLSMEPPNARYETDTKRTARRYCRAVLFVL